MRFRNLNDKQLKASHDSIAIMNRMLIIKDKMNNNLVENLIELDIDINEVVMETEVIIEEPSGIIGLQSNAPSIQRLMAYVIGFIHVGINKYVTWTQITGISI